MARSVRGSAVGKKFDKGMTKHVCAKALDQAVQEGWLVQEGNYVRARPNQETPIHGRFVPTSFAPCVAAPALIWDGRRGGEEAAIDYR